MDVDQCLARGLSCSGPPDFFETHLRDETNKIVTSQSRRATTSMWVHLFFATFKHADGKSDPGDSLMLPPTLDYALTISPDNLARGFLFSACETADYVTPYPGWGPFIQCLPTLLSTSAKQSPLQIALEALSFCVMSLLPGHSAYARRANLSYGAALRRINLAISDQNESLSDETLMATLLMSIYEVWLISRVDEYFHLPHSSAIDPRSEHKPEASI